MIDIHDPAQDRDTRLEDLAAELTSTVYPLLLRRGLEGSWLNMELGLWRALAETFQEWARQRPPAALCEAKSGLYQDFQQTIRRCLHGN